MTNDSQISVHDVSERLKTEPQPILLDIREQAEWDIVHLPGAQLATQELIDEIIRGWDRDAEMICYCHHGIRSLNAAGFLAQQGFTRVKSMSGGIDRWAEEIDPTLPRY